MPGVLVSETEVWVAEPTDYDEYGIIGVYESPEAAKAALHHVGEWQWDGEDWTAVPAHHHLRIYPEKVRTLEGIRETERVAVEARSPAALKAEREQLRAEVRVPLPYE